MDSNTCLNRTEGTSEVILSPLKHPWPFHKCLYLKLKSFPLDFPLARALKNKSHSPYNTSFSSAHYILTIPHVQCWNEFQNNLQVPQTRHLKFIFVPPPWDPQNRTPVLSVILLWIYPTFFLLTDLCLACIISPLDYDLLAECLFVWACPALLFALHSAVVSYLSITQIQCVASAYNLL